MMHTVLKWFLCLVFSGLCMPVAQAQTVKTPTPYLIVKAEGLVTVQGIWSRSRRKQAVRSGLQKAVHKAVEKWSPKEKWKEHKEKFAALWSSRNAPLFVYGFQVLTEKRVGNLYSVSLKVMLLREKLRKQYQKILDSIP